MDVVEVRIAYLTFPPIHKIDGLRQLCATSLIDAACVHPHPIILIFLPAIISRALGSDSGITDELAQFIHLDKPRRRHGT